jgi:hypothetical protein
MDSSARTSMNAQRGARSASTPAPTHPADMSAAAETASSWYCTSPGACMHKLLKRLSCKHAETFRVHCSDYLTCTPLNPACHEQNDVLIGTQACA